MNRTAYEIYRAIKSYMNKEGKSPSMKDLSLMVNKNTGTIFYNLKKLRKSGYIDYQDKEARSIKILKDFIITYE